MIVLDILMLVFFNSDTILGILISALGMLGFWGIFKKCGVKPWWALVPCFRYYYLGLCTALEPEGRMVFVTEALTVLLNILVYFLPVGSGFSLLFTALGLVVLVFDLIFTIRIDLGLIELFERKKWWLLPLLLAGFIAYLLLGWSRRYQPKWKVTDYVEQAAALSGAK